MKWDDVVVADVVIFERGDTIVSGKVIDIFEGNVVLEHAGPFLMEQWTLVHTVTALSLARMAGQVIDTEG